MERATKKETKLIIKTGAWSAPLPPNHIKIGISRGSPRGMPAGYRLFKTLAPGGWFNSVSIPEYLARYNAILAGLSPDIVAQQIIKLADGKAPVLCCFEKVTDIHKGASWCHRSIAAQWFEDRLGIVVEELHAPEGFDRFAKLRRENIAPPSYL